MEKQWLIIAIIKHFIVNMKKIQVKMYMSREQNLGGKNIKNLPAVSALNRRDFCASDFTILIEHILLY